MTLSAGCAGGSVVVYDETLTGYDFGPEHPMNPVRVDLTMRLTRSLGLLDLPGGLRAVPAPDATDADLLLVHDPALIEAVRRSSADPAVHDARFGLGTDDNPTFANMHAAARHIVGASLEAARQVWTGTSIHAANITGGLHHAMPAAASGFCVYNDVAVAIQWLLDNGAKKVAYVDVDVHHGDGVQKIFYDDPRVLTISLHETGQMLFPGTGYPVEAGGPGAVGTSVNVALPPGTADAGWLRAFHAVVPPLVRAFEPDILITQHGCDSHAADPLAHLMLSVDGHRASYLALHDLAHEVCGGRWVATGGGGYAVVEVVPRSWTHLLAIVGGTPLDPQSETTEQWRGEIAERLGTRAPLLMTDGSEPVFRDFSEGADPDSWLDRAITETRASVFPEHGLDPASW
jgi:acetoin utilization protein AcuC